MNDKTFASLLRQKIVFFIVLGFFVVLLFQLFQVQILNHDLYYEKSNENSVKGVIEEAPRGVFFDRNYHIMVSNKPTFSLEITPYNYDHRLNPVLEHVLRVDTGYVEKMLAINEDFSKFTPRKIIKNIGYDVVAWIEENSEKLPGVSYVVDMQRQYADSIAAPHAFGYIKEINAAGLQAHKDYHMGDYIGFSGIEKKYEKYLRGQNGVHYSLVDSRQRRIGPYHDGKDDKLPVKGNDLVLTLDADAQQAAELAFGDHTGGLVAIEPSSGEILAFVSAPEYSLANFSSVTSREVWNSLAGDPRKPLFNRATMSVNPPGSTYKMLLAIAALEEGVITPTSIINCPGGYHYGNRVFRCHGGPHGALNVVSAIEKSCNTFFFSLMMKLGLNKWTDYSRRFGFGSKTGVDIGEESAGIVPSQKYYDRAFGRGKWGPGNTISLGIGQGELSVSPIQLAQYCALLANYGVTKKPHMVRGYVDTRTHRMVNFKFDQISTGVSRKTFDLVRYGMLRVVESGTGSGVRLPNIKMAGKTGTAQNPHGRDHALFIGFAPYDNPKIAVAVIVENVGFGATYAAPIARDVIKAYLDKSYKVPKTGTVFSPGGGRD